VTYDPDFKVTTFLKSNIGKKRGVLKTKLLFHTNRKLYLTYGMVLCLVTLIDMKLSWCWQTRTWRGFVSISWASCMFFAACLH